MNYKLGEGICRKNGLNVVLHSKSGFSDLLRTMFYTVFILWSYGRDTCYMLILWYIYALSILFSYYVHASFIPQPYFPDTSTITYKVQFNPDPIGQNRYYRNKKIPPQKLWRDKILIVYFIYLET